MRCFSRFLVLALVFFGVVAAGESAYAEEADGPVKVAPRVEVEAKAGTMRGLGSLKLFYPLQAREDALWFADLRGVFSSDPSLEGNFGIGYRRMAEDKSHILGGYAFYDRRRSSFGSLFNQATLGLEILREQSEFRINAYVPEAEGKLLESAEADAVTVRGRQVVYEDASLNTFERAMGGFDIEVGGALASGERESRFYFSGYHFTAPNVTDMIGVRLGLETEWHDALASYPGSSFTLGVEGQHDYVRGIQGFVTMGLSVPFGRGKASGVGRDEAPGIAGRLGETVRRDIDVVTSKTEPVRVIASEGPAVNPATGEPLGEVWYFTSDGSGDGSEESPTDVEEVEAKAKAGDVLVARGEAGPINTGAGGLVLKEGQILLSPGGSVLLGSLNGQTAALTLTGEQATLTNDAATDIVMLADDTAVAGINFEGGRAAIVGLEVGGAITIQGNHIADTAWEGIYLGVPLPEGAEAKTLSRVSIADNRVEYAGAGIGLDLETDALALGVTGNEITGSGWEGIRVGVNANVLTAVVADNVIVESEQDGLKAEISAGTSADVVVAGNIVDEAWAEGINLNVSAGSVNLGLFENEVLHADLSGILLDLSGDAMTVDVADNYVTDSTSYGVLLSAAANQTADVTVLGTVVESSWEEDGLRALVTAGDSARVTFAENDVFDVEGYGLYLSADAADLELVVAENSVAEAAASGMFLFLQGDSAAVGIQDNVIESTGLMGLHLQAEHDSTVLDISGNEVDATEDAGIYVLGLGDTGSFELGMSDNWVGNTSGKGIWGVIATGGGEDSSTRVEISDNEVADVKEAGIDVKVMSDAGPIDAAIEGNVVTGVAEVDGSGAYGISATLAAPEATSLSVSENAVSGVEGSYAEGIMGGAISSESSATVDAFGNDVTGIYGGDYAGGLRAQAMAKGAATAFIEDNAVADIQSTTQAAGIFGGVDGMEAELFLTGNSVSRVTSESASGIRTDAFGLDALDVEVFGNVVESIEGLVAYGIHNRVMSADNGVLHVAENDVDGIMASDDPSALSNGILADLAGTVVASVAGNSVQDAGDGVYIVSIEHHVEALMEANTITSVERGIVLDTGATAHIDATLNDNEVDATGTSVAYEGFENVTCQGTDCN